VKVICQKNGATSKVFTDGKVYETFQDSLIDPKSKLKAIKDDVGYTRYIIPDELSPHLVIVNALDIQIPVGKFVEV
jgi:hypothetical protein